MGDGISTSFFPISPLKKTYFGQFGITPNKAQKTYNFTAINSFQILEHALEN